MIASRRVFAACSIAIALLSIAILSARTNAQAPATNTSNASLKELRAERIATLKEGITFATQLMEQRSAGAEPALDHLTRELVNAELEAAASDADRVNILNLAIAAARKREEMVERLRKAGSGTFNLIDVKEAKAYRQGLEIQLSLATTKPR